MKSIWSGSLSFGMVNIPIKLYSTVEHSAAPGFKLLHAEDQSPVEYRRYCKKQDKEVPWSEIVKGLEVEPGSFFLFTKEELAKLKPEKSDQIEIIEFIPPDQVDRVYLDAHYFIGPEKKKERAFFIFAQALAKSKKEAVGRFVMREKEYTCVISPYETGLLLSTLNYSYELRSIKGVENVEEKVEIKPQEMELAVALVDKLSVAHFDISRFKDEFAEHLKEAIAKRDRKELVTIEKEKKETPEENLMEVLKQSLEA
ncbi:MAG: Ku70/Ku80 beta-barrel domain protein [Methanomassiliicoccales archaeon PtaU1.Bin124]|nr:MAG: Ku70/Ku80 beta-barrel domain protein [Methanomassiliicoccales archaeon PtaU1.Bin124]